MKGERPGECPYCGGAMQGPHACAEHRELEASDPARGASRGVTSERELGVAAPWPESELEDRGGER